MIAHTSGFKNAITTLGRDINVLIDYYSVVYNLITEDDKLIITQDNLELLTEEMSTQQPTSHLTNDDIILLNRNNLGELFRTYMKSFDLETPHKFNVGDKMIINIGTSVNGEIEYLNYGMYYVYQRKYNEDKQTYTYTLCDRMLFTMIKYDNDTIFGNNNTLSCSQVVANILNYCGFSGAIQFENFYFVNNNKSISKETFANVNMTCRDVLDMITQLQGCSLLIGYDATTKKDYITNKRISQSSVDTIDDDILKNSNITLGKKYGKLNSLLFSRSEGIDNIERKDDTSILEDGKTQYIIKDNLILNQENRVDFIDNLFNVMNGLEYYICDIDTIGLGYIEYLDRFTINANGNLYNTICLKNTSNISNGMKENYTTEEIQETAQTFENIGTDDKTASITMDKLKGQIVLKTYVDEGDGKTKLAQVRLDSSGDEGSSVEIDADNIDFNSHTFNLTTDNIKIDSRYFQVDEYGNMKCSLAEMIQATLKGGITFDNDEQTGAGSILFPNAREDSTTIQIDGVGGATTDIWPDIYYIWYPRTSNVAEIKLGHLASNRYGLFVKGNGTGYCYYEEDGEHPSSDRRCKDNIEKIDKKQSIDIITNLEPVSFTYKEDIKYHRGLIAQDVKEVLNKNGIENQIYQQNEENDLYTLKYTELIPDLINCVKYQQEEIEELKKEINNLKGGNK